MVELVSGDRSELLRKISFRKKGAFQRFYRGLKLNKPRHCSFIRATLVRLGQKLSAQSTL
jgi:hypothetical protein